MRKRLRKKLRVGEFDVQLLPIALELEPFDSNEARNSFLDRFCDAVDAADLDFGGGGMGTDWSGFAEPTGRSLTISEEQAQQVRLWTEAQPEIRRSKVWPIMRDSEASACGDANPDFPVPQDWTANQRVQAGAASRSDGRDEGDE